MLVRGRYAPSPTGRLHLGNARTALVAWLSARAQGGAFVLRVEDVDRQRCRPAFATEQIDDLRWLGLDWDEGPDVGGPHAPYQQSERDDAYARACAGLPTYACTCTRRELRQATMAPEGEEPVYPGTCRARVGHPERDAALRLRVPEGSVTATDDRLGACTQDFSADIGDFLLRRRDGAWAYQLAVVVDDIAMGITEVVRGEDLWSSTPRQVHLWRALGHAAPRWLHVPLLRGPDGTKLSKRDGAPDVATLREGGADPDVVVAALARSLGLCDAHVARVRARELVSDFDPARLRSVSAEENRVRALVAGP